jgi:hypothetical protein
MREIGRVALAGAGAASVAEMLRVATSAVILVLIALALFLCAEAIGRPLAGWASAQAFATLAPV